MYREETMDIRPILVRLGFAAVMLQPVEAPAAVFAGSRETVPLAGTSEGVFRSSDGGEYWTSMNLGLSNLFVTSLAIDISAGVLYAGTLAGVFEVPLPSMTRFLAPR
jgi:hypothetical protein